jgi:amino acid transporter
MKWRIWIRADQRARHGREVGFPRGARCGQQGDDPATRHLRELAAGTTVIVPTGSVIHLPAGTVVPLAEGAVVKSWFNLPAVFITLAVTMLLVIGVSESATVNNIIVAIKVAVILAFIGVGAFFVNPDNWHPFIPEPTGV